VNNTYSAKSLFLNDNYEKCNEFLDDVTNLKDGKLVNRFTGVINILERKTADGENTSTDVESKSANGESNDVTILKEF
jgi:hypothetical protein